MNKYKESSLAAQALLLFHLLLSIRATLWQPQARLPPRRHLPLQIRRSPLPRLTAAAATATDGVAGPIEKTLSKFAKSTARARSVGGDIDGTTLLHTLIVIGMGFLS